MTDDTHTTIPKPGSQPPSTVVRQLGVAAAESARDKMLSAFRENQIDELTLAQVAHELLHATTSKMQWDAKTGMWQESPDQQDNTTRYNMTRLLLDFFDTMPSKKIDIKDERQTKQIAGQLMHLLEQQGDLGSDDLEEVIDVESTEVELMSDMYEKRQAAQRDDAPPAPTPTPDAPHPHPRHASLIPVDDNDQ